MAELEDPASAEVWEARTQAYMEAVCARLYFSNKFEQAQVDAEGR